MKKVFGWHNHNMRVASKQQALAYFYLNLKMVKYDVFYRRSILLYRFISSMDIYIFHQGEF